MVTARVGARVDVVVALDLGGAAAGALDTRNPAVVLTGVSPTVCRSFVDVQGAALARKGNQSASWRT